MGIGTKSTLVVRKTPSGSNSSSKTKKIKVTTTSGSGQKQTKLKSTGGFTQSKHGSTVA